MTDYINFHLNESPDESLLRQARSEICNYAIALSVKKFINQYSISRRLLGYLNRLPQELGRYGQALEEQVRAKKFPVGIMLTRPLAHVEEEYYQCEDQLHRTRKLYDIEDRTLSMLFSNNIKKIIEHNTVDRIITSWINLVEAKSPFSLLPRIFKKLVTNHRYLIERADHARGLGTIIKNATKEVIKIECRANLNNIELRFGFSPIIPGLMVTPDVEDLEPLVIDFISNTAILNNITKIVEKFPTLEPVLKAFQDQQKKNVGPEEQSLPH